jgi:hypothetical protein
MLSSPRVDAPSPPLNPTPTLPSIAHEPRGRKAMPPTIFREPLKRAPSMPRLACDTPVVRRLSPSRSVPALHAGQPRQAPDNDTSARPAKEPRAALPSIFASRARGLDNATWAACTSRLRPELRQSVRNNGSARATAPRVQRFGQQAQPPPPQPPSSSSPSQQPAPVKRAGELSAEQHAAVGFCFEYATSTSAAASGGSEPDRVSLAELKFAVRALGFTDEEERAIILDSVALKRGGGDGVGGGRGGHESGGGGGGAAVFSPSSPRSAIMRGTMREGTIRDSAIRLGLTDYQQAFSRAASWARPEVLERLSSIGCAVLSSGLGEPGGDAGDALAPLEAFPFAMVANAHRISHLVRTRALAGGRRREWEGARRRKKHLDTTTVSVQAEAQGGGRQQRRATLTSVMSTPTLGGGADADGGGGGGAPSPIEASRPGDRHRTKSVRFAWTGGRTRGLRATGNGA